MLSELRARHLGVIEDLTLVVEPGMTVLTGETGAGKTLVVGAIELLLGGRADPALVRPGAEEASVEGRFSPRAEAYGIASGSSPSPSEDLILSRVVPAAGRARAYIDGRMSSSAALTAAGVELVDLHGQHAHQSLLSAQVQRQSVDAFGSIDLQPLTTARQQLRRVVGELSALGGDARSRAREIDLLRFQIDELAAAGLQDPGEEDTLRAEEERLSDAGADRLAASSAYDALAGDECALEHLGSAAAAVSGRSVLKEIHDRLRSVAAELADVARDTRELSESLEEDPARLAAVSARRHLLADLRRKYGESLADVIAYQASAVARLADLESHDERAAGLDAERVAALAAVTAAETMVGEHRRAVAPVLAAAIQDRLQILAMARARFEVVIGDGPSGEDVTWMLGANPGEPVLPLTKVASGGELARTMLAVRLVLAGLEPSAANLASGWSRTLVFDEVDAGIGGEAAVAVGRALLSLADRYQVIVVTHLPQVAAFAHHHVVVRKAVVGERTVSEVEQLDDSGRVIELARMLSGQPGSDTARRHAEELLALAHATA